MKRTPLKRTPMKRPKQSPADRKAAKWRAARCQEIGYCMMCGTSGVFDMNPLCVHEIKGAALKEKTRDKSFATLVLCWRCNGEHGDDTANWPDARQLALIKIHAPRDYDLAAFLELTGQPATAITEDEVQRYIKELSA